VNSPDTLCSRVLKGKYFPNDDFLVAKNKRNSSHTRHAILAGWIPGAIDGRLVFPKLGASAFRVSELLAEGGGRWDEAALDQKLLAMDAQAVKRIPLGRRQEDI